MRPTWRRPASRGGRDRRRAGVPERVRQEAKKTTPGAVGPLRRPASHVYYFYVLDDDFGPGFVKLCTYFPYPAKVWLNGHEWAKRQATGGLAFTASPTASRPAMTPPRCRRSATSPRHRPRALLRTLAGPHPVPLTADRAAGYWWERSMRQVEVSRTIVFDAPRRARAFFEALVGDNLDLGRPDEVQLIFDRRSAKTPEAPSRPGSSPAASRSPSTSSTSTPGSSSTSRKAGRCASRRWSTSPPTSAASVACPTCPSCNERPGPPTGGCLPCNVPARAVPSRPSCSSGSHCPRQEGQRTGALRFGDPRAMALAGALRAPRRHRRHQPEPARPRRRTARRATRQPDELRLAACAARA